MKDYVNEIILTVLVVFFGYFAMRGNTGAQYFAVGSFSSLLILINPQGKGSGAPVAPSFPNPTDPSIKP